MEPDTSHSAASSPQPRAVYVWVAIVAIMLLVLLLTGLLLQSRHMGDGNTGGGVPEKTITLGQGGNADTPGGGNGGIDGKGNADIVMNVENPTAAGKVPLHVETSEVKSAGVAASKRVTQQENPQPGLIDEDLPTPVDSPVALAGEKPSPGIGNGNAALQGQPSQSIFHDGKTSSAKRIVYIIDASGSMDGQKFDLARAELAKSLKLLAKEQLFYIVFFNDAPIEMPSKNMMRATVASLAKIGKWLPALKAASGTEVAKPLEIALSKQPDEIWLLTDGMVADADQAEALMDAYRKKYPGRKFRLNTIAFIDPDGIDLLKKWAEKYGGTYKYVNK